MSKKSFGTFLREQRLKVGYGLRSFAQAIEMQPSNLSNIEHDRIPPPQDENILTRIAETIGIKKKSKEWSLLFDLAIDHKEAGLPSDIAKFAKQNPGVPVLLRTIENKKLTPKKLKELANYINETF